MALFHILAILSFAISRAFFSYSEIFHKLRCLLFLLFSSVSVVLSLRLIVGKHKAVTALQPLLNKASFKLL